jgi:MYND finger
MLVSAIDVDTFLFIGEMLDTDYLQLSAVAKWKFAKDILSNSRKGVLMEVFETLAAVEGLLSAAELAKLKPKAKEEKKKEKEAKKKEAKEAKKEAKEAKKNKTPATPSSPAPAGESSTGAVAELKCAHCGSAGTEEKKLSRCSRCMGVAYCSRQCQAADWAKHKTACQRVQLLNVTLSDGKTKKVPVAQGVTLPVLVKTIHEQIAE